MAKVKVYELAKELNINSKGSPHRTTQKESEHHCGI